MAMRAAVIDRFGGPDVLRVAEREVPVPGPGQLLVEVVAASVNPVDASNRADGSWAGIELPATLGSDAAGIVAAVGPGVTDFQTGDDVFYFSDFLGAGDGSYAEYQVVDASTVARRPAGLSFAQAAAVPLAAGTAHELVVRRLAVRHGQRVLIVGASGGVGTFAVQMAQAAGARVVAVAGRARHPALRDLGAEAALDYHDGDLWEQVRREGPIDAVVDLAGDAAPHAIEVLEEGGALGSVVALAGDFDAAIDKNLTLHGVLVRPDAARLGELSRMIDRGVLAPVVSQEFALQDIAAAHRQIESGHTFGKLVIRVRPEL
jgi:NADPH2:quinone reductase